MPHWARMLGGLVALGAVVTAVVVQTGGGPEAPQAKSSASPSPTATGSPAPLCPDTQSPWPWPANAVAMVMPWAAPGYGGTIERRDVTATAGAWTVLLRAADGGFAEHGAVVTFPVARPGAQESGSAWSTPTSGTAGPGAATWPLAGSFGRVRGELTADELVAVVDGTTVVDGRPVVRPPKGWKVVATVPYRPPVVREARYAALRLGQAGADLGGLVFTGVARTGALDDWIYATGTDATRTVRGYPAVVTSVLGGNGALAWEPAPGTVAYVGYSGSLVSPAAIDALQCLAERATPITVSDWQATGPQAIRGSNDVAG